MDKCIWTTATDGSFITTCGFQTDWKIPELDFYKFCPFYGKELKIKTV